MQISTVKLKLHQIEGSSKLGNHYLGNLQFTPDKIIRLYFLT